MKLASLFVVRSFAAAILLPAVLAADEPGKTAAAHEHVPARRGNPVSPTSLLDLLARVDVQRELDLLDEQLLALEEYRAAFAEDQRERLRHLLGEMRTGNIDHKQLRDRLQDEMMRASRAAREKIHQVLLPHQIKRLDQIDMQRRIRSGGLNVVGAREIAATLNISDDQREKMHAMNERAEAELRRRMAELRAGMQRQILEMLTPEQKLKLQDMVGPPFEFRTIPRDTRRGREPTPAKPPDSSEPMSDPSSSHNES